MKKIVLIYSGGLDSTVLLFELLAQGHEVLCLSVDYGQRHRKELEHALRICQSVQAPHRFADLSGCRALLAGSSQTSDDIDVPEGHYADENMKLTVVPNRNMIMLSVAIGWAVSVGADAVAYAAHNGDHAIYPDCREEFAEGMAQVAMLCDWRGIELLRPFVHMSKGDVVKRGAELDVPFLDTWSCYKGLRFHCGKCGTCVERKEAFAEAGVGDPTLYEEDMAGIDSITLRPRFGEDFGDFSERYHQAIGYHDGHWEAAAK